MNVCYENKSTVCRGAVRNFRRDVGRPAVFGEQAQQTTSFCSEGN